MNLSANIAASISLRIIGLLAYHNHQVQKAMFHTLDPGTGIVLGLGLVRTSMSKLISADIASLVSAILRYPLPI